MSPISTFLNGGGFNVTPVTVEDWHVVGDAGEPDLSTGKENSDGSGADIPAFTSSDDGFYSQLRFFKDPFGIVHLAGQAFFAALTYQANGSGGVIGEIFTLPSGYRPATLAQIFPGQNTGGLSSVSSLEGHGFVIDTNGRLADAEYYLNPDVLANQYFDQSSIGDSFTFDGISFRAA